MPSDSAFGIVEPFPENIYPLEFTPAQVTCVAFDAAGIRVPEKIKFMRRDEFNRFEELTPNDNLYFTNRSTQEGKYCIYILYMYLFRAEVCVHDNLLVAFTCSQHKCSNRKCVVPENIHTPTTEEIGNSEGVGRVNDPGNS